MKKILSLFLALFVLSGCASMGSKDVSAPNGEYEMMSEESAVYEPMMMDSMDESSRLMIADPEVYGEDAEQKIIKTGSLSLHMESVRDGAEAIQLSVEEIGGQVTNSNITRYSNSYYATLTVQVPSEQFDAAMELLKGMALYVSSEYTNADNVTEAYMDLEARLSNLQEEEAQYLAILDKAVTVEEILQVTDYLSNVRYEIESIEGQLKYYDSNVDYSTISLTLTEDESVEAVQESWRPGSTFNEAVSDWMIFLQDFVDFGIYLVIFGWPVLLIALAVFIWKRRNGKKRK